MTPLYPLSMSKKIIAAIGLTIAACQAADFADSAGDSVARSRHGDTTIIVTRGKGVWGPVHDAVEVLRVSETSKETTFGQIQTLAATADGGVLIYDTKSPEGLIIRKFSSDGKFVRNIGRTGRGPGEYDSDMLRIVEQANGTILVRQVFRGVSRFSADGRYLGGFEIDHRNLTHEIFGAADGSIYVRGPVGMGFRIIAMDDATVLHYDTAGKLLDSTVAGPPWLVTSDPPAGFGGPTPTQAWFPLSDGRKIVGRTDKLGFLLVDPGGQSTPLIAEVAIPPIVYSDEERAELQAIEEWKEINYRLVENGKVVVEGPKAAIVPKNKMPAKGIQASIDGRIWIGKSPPSRKVEPFVTAAIEGNSIKKSYAEEERLFVVFQPDGTYLGEVRFPKQTGHLVFAGDFAWATTSDDDDVPVLVKYRIR
jgi:hypothetical protein